MSKIFRTRKLGSVNVDVPKCQKYKEALELIRHISFVDCPGHDILINIKLCIMYGYSFITYSSKCHLSVIENMDLENIIITKNKIDLLILEN